MLPYFGKKVFLFESGKNGYKHLESIDLFQFSETEAVGRSSFRFPLLQGAERQQKYVKNVSCSQPIFPGRISRALG